MQATLNRNSTSACILKLDACPTMPLSRYVQAHRKGEFPRDLVPELAELGVFGASLHGYGCAGMNSVAYGLIMQVRVGFWTRCSADVACMC